MGGRNLLAASDRVELQLEAAMKEFKLNLGNKDIVIEFEEPLLPPKQTSFKTAIKRAKSERDLLKVLKEWAEREGVKMTIK
jgi:hypothetical protein